MDEKKTEKTMAQKMRLRNELVTAMGLGLMLLGAMWVVVTMAEPNVYLKLRSDEYMDDPTIPYNERDNATYTFTDDWFSETHNRLIWWSVPGIIIFALGVIPFYMGDLMFRDTEIHKQCCKGGEARYCPECGLKLSRLEKD